MIIKQEEKNQYNLVEELIKSSFETAEHTDKNEHNLVKKLRNSDAYIKELSLVALEDEKLVGHIMFTKAKVNDTDVLVLAPLSVSPDFQRKGVGKNLIQKGHETAKKLGFDIIIVLGSELYYPKFGYIPAKKFGIIAPFEVPSENFMAVSLSGNDEKLNGIVEYAKEFFE